MLYVALALTGALAVTVIVLTQLLRSAQRDAARERQAAQAERARLADQVCHLAGATWTPPPRPPADRFEEGQPDEWVLDADQLIVEV